MIGEPVVNQRHKLGLPDPELRVVHDGPHGARLTVGAVADAKLRVGAVGVWRAALWRPQEAALDQQAVEAPCCACCVAVLLDCR
jgi:hypothetical protein